MRRLSATLIGYHGRDAFSVVQVYEWDTAGMEKRKRKGRGITAETRKWRLGFWDKQEMSLKVSLVSYCPCNIAHSVRITKQWIDKVISERSLDREGGISLAITPRHPDTLDSSSERVFTAEIQRTGSLDPAASAWFFFVTENAAARWLALERMEQVNGDKVGFRGVVRRNNCSVECACRAIREKSFVLL